MPRKKPGAEFGVRDDLTDAEDEVRANTGGLTMWGVDVSGTFVGTVTLETLYGTTWVAAKCLTTALASGTNTLTAAGQRVIVAPGAAAVRARMSAFTSGTATVILSGTPAAGPTA